MYLAHSTQNIQDVYVTGQSVTQFKTGSVSDLGTQKARGMKHHAELRKIARRCIQTLLNRPRQDAANRETGSARTDSLPNQIQNVQPSPTVSLVR